MTSKNVPGWLNEHLCIDRVYTVQTVTGTTSQIMISTITFGGGWDDYQYFARVQYESIKPGIHGLHCHPYGDQEFLDTFNRDLAIMFPEVVCWFLEELRFTKPDLQTGHSISLVTGRT